MDIYDTCILCYLIKYYLFNKICNKINSSDINKDDITVIIWIRFEDPYNIMEKKLYGAI